MLNEAYNMLMINILRKEYNASIGEVTADFGKEFLGSSYSLWNGFVRAQGLFVDEKLMHRMLKLQVTMLFSWKYLL